MEGENIFMLVRHQSRYYTTGLIYYGRPIKQNLYTGVTYPKSSSNVELAFFYEALFLSTATSFVRWMSIFVVENHQADVKSRADAAYTLHETVCCLYTENVQQPNSSHRVQRRHSGRHYTGRGRRVQTPVGLAECCMSRVPHHCLRPQPQHTNSRLSKDSARADLSLRGALDRGRTM